MKTILSKWRERRARRNRSEWDSPITGTDLLATMLVTQKMRKGRKLP